MRGKFLPLVLLAALPLWSRGGVQSGVIPLNGFIDKAVKVTASPEESLGYAFLLDDTDRHEIGTWSLSSNLSVVVTITHDDLTHETTSTATILYTLSAELSENSSYLTTENSQGGIVSGTYSGITIYSDMKLYAQLAPEPEADSLPLPPGYYYSTLTFTVTGAT